MPPMRAKRAEEREDRHERQLSSLVKAGRKVLTDANQPSKGLAKSSIIPRKYYQRNPLEIDGKGINEKAALMEQKA